MCGILVHTGKGNNEFIKRRGILTTSKKIGGIYFNHTLLPINGHLQQPIYEDGVAMVMNGEIYNHKFKESDSEVIIPIYREYGLRFPSYLDGEFAIALYDFRNNVALFVTDLFGTKPLWRNGIECGSYKSGVGGKMLAPNTIEGVNIQTGQLLFSSNWHEWDWNQYKRHYDDWISAFEHAIQKRATDRCFIGLSSGYDSGAISKELTKQGVSFKAFSFLNNEDEKVIKKRWKYIYEHEEVRDIISKEELEERIEPIEYRFSNEKLVREDIAAQGLASICKRAKREGRDVCLSGQGADEIIGDYKLYPRQSNFQGKFPFVLTEWENFSGGFQRDYLNKEEYVGGAYAIETRYPFLDKDVVQEFLWLTPKLKNREYKAPIYEYLTRNNVPFNKEVKKGFRPLPI